MERPAFRRVLEAIGTVAFLAGLGLSAPAWAQQAPQYGSPSYGTPYGQPPTQYGQPPAQYGQPQPQYGQPPTQYGQAGPEAPQLLTPDQLDNLVAPIALYPDQLLSEVLAASTYPLEIVDAEQWLQQNRNVPAAQRMDAAKQQSWDPSIQALVAFPDILDILGHDIRWTTDLGNAFLAQQADVMNAIQTMRARAQQSGSLQSTPQQTVSTQYQDGQSAIQIEPANPQMIYPPIYQPAAVWGPPAYGAYPALWYPPAWGVGGGIGFGGLGAVIGGIAGLARVAFAPGIFIGSLFAGLLGFGGWGWGLSWFAHALFLNPLFLGHFGFHGYGGGYGGGFGGATRAAWVHDPAHRMGVPYSNRAVASRFGGRVGGPGGAAMAARSNNFGRAEAPRAESGRSQAGRFEAGRSEANGAYRGAGSAGARTPYAGGNQFAARAAPQSSGGAYGRSFEGNREATRGAGGYGGGSYNSGGYNRTGPSQSFAAPRAQENRAPSRAESPSRASQNMARNFSAPSAPRGSSEPRASSAPHGGGGSSHASAPHSGGHSGGGHSGGGHSSGGHSSGHKK
jgi:hypothetical protein